MNGRDHLAETVHAAAATITALPVSSPASVEGGHDDAVRLLDAVELAGILRVSIRKLRRLDDAGEIPAAIRLGRAKHWLLQEIILWLRAGAPSRKEWASIRSENLRSGLGAPRDVEGGLAHRR